MVAGAEVQVQSDVPARMRDGVILRADVYRPAGAGPFPVLLTRTPYGKSMLPMAVETNRALAARGYIVVAQDVRGRFASEGVYRINQDDIADGYDAIAWAAGLEGATGAVGMFGVSYMGITQLLAAADQPPQLKAIFPIQCRANQYPRPYYGGAFHLGDRLGWSLMQAVDAADRLGLDAPEIRRYGALTRERMTAMLAGDQERVARVRAEILAIIEPWLRFLPLRDLPVLEGTASYYVEQLDHPTNDDFWHAMDVARRFSQFDLPCFSVGGWYDLMLQGNIDIFTGLHARSRTPEARRAQRLLIGPWTHGQFVPQAGELDFGPAAAIDLVELQTRWFDHWLKGIESGVLEEPPVRLFVMGVNRWRDERQWPLSGATYVPYYFHSGGQANTLNGDGVLSPARPGDEPADSYTYDPDDPVPSVGGKTLGLGSAPGPFDQRQVQARPDLLCYTTAPLQADLEVIGPLSVTLYAASSAIDTDWTAKLVDVHPDGYAQNLQEGIIRASYRVPGAVPSPIRPGEVYEFAIDLWATANVFRAGHRIRVEISSSNFPHWDRNTNTGLPGATADRTVTARQTVFHDAARPSHILLPIIPGGAS
ncbi:MAG: CocE/NonD family hydrolase [Dehalococcoidia bacterium]